MHFFTIAYFIFLSAGFIAVTNAESIGMCMCTFQAVDVMVTDITTKVDWQVTNVNQFVMELTKFAEIQSQIDEAKSRISGLQTSCSEVEDELVLLEDLCSEMQQNNNRFEHEYQLRKYRERKHLELEQVKGQCEPRFLFLDSRCATESCDGLSGLLHLDWPLSLVSSWR